MIEKYNYNAVNCWQIFQHPFCKSGEFSFAKNRYYAVRWTIETSYQYLKESLGFDEYKVRSLVSIERYMLLCFLAYNFLEYYRVRRKQLNLDTIGDTIEHMKKESIKDFVDFVYYHAKNDVPLVDIYAKLKLVA